MSCIRLFPSKWTCVYSAFRPCHCHGTISRPSRSWGQPVRVSVSLLSSTEGLSEWRPDGPLGGMEVAVGTSYELRGITHACITNTPCRTKMIEGLRVGHGGRVPVWVERRTTGLLALERFHAPISNEMHRPRHTRHTHTAGYCLCPCTRIRWKKHGTWWKTSKDYCVHIDFFKGQHPCL